MFPGRARGSRSAVREGRGRDRGEGSGEAAGEEQEEGLSQGWTEASGERPCMGGGRFPGRAP